jgi:high-affinity nickel permease
MIKQAVILRTIFVMLVLALLAMVLLVVSRAYHLLHIGFVLGLFYDTVKMETTCYCETTAESHLTA